MEAAASRGDSLGRCSGRHFGGRKGLVAILTAGAAAPRHRCPAWPTRSSDGASVWYPFKFRGSLSYSTRGGSWPMSSEQRLRRRPGNGGGGGGSLSGPGSLPRSLIPPEGRSLRGGRTRRTIALAASICDARRPMACPCGQRRDAGAAATRCFGSSPGSPPPRSSAAPDRWLGGQRPSRAGP